MNTLGSWKPSPHRLIDEEDVKATKKQAAELIATFKRDPAAAQAFLARIGLEPRAKAKTPRR